MGTGYTRQNSGVFVTSATIEASHFEPDFQGLNDAFDASTGHNHDGTTGNGAKINLTSSIVGILLPENGGIGDVTLSSNEVLISNGTNSFTTGSITDAGKNLIQLADTVSTDQIIYSTGDNTFSTTTISVAGIDIIQLATVAPNKILYTNDTDSYTGSAISGAGLSLANLTTATTDSYIYATGINTFGLGTITSAGRDLVAYSTTASIQQGLDLEPTVDIASLNDTQSFTKQQGFPQQIVTASTASTAINLDDNQSVKVILTTNTTISFSNPISGYTYALIIQQDSGGGNTLAFADSVSTPAGIAYAVSTGSGDKDGIGIVYDGDSLEYMLFPNKNFG